MAWRRPTWLLSWFTVVSVLVHSSLHAATLGVRSLNALSHDDVQALVTASDPLKNLDPQDPSSHLAHILIPRVSGTENNTRVRKYIVSTLQNIGWHVEEDTFNDTTPLGQKTFTNIIATKDPAASRRVVLAAHFDSKYFEPPNDEFVGATDSAAPCAMMLDLAKVLNPLLDARAKRLEDGLEDDEDVADTTLQLVFFDGEEAFVEWTDTDSVYGARHLAEKWRTTYPSPLEKRRLVTTSQLTELSSVEHLILLDLLGAAQPSIRSYFIDTAWLFDALASVEKRLGDSGAFAYGHVTGMGPGKWKSYFVPRVAPQINMGYISDDHVPFLKHGVSILHLIAYPFPRVWHTIKDDASALDLPTMRRWNIMLRVFMSEYLNLQPSEDGKRRAIERSPSDLVCTGLYSGCL
ncbi:hypothetical protein FISHEDRAFT_37909 [Fistulina hepatica ATCC 64428]|nr:hypothetical protein FISHEDRAFT_37909 [Fistulina hepatica ATCC 64428]